MNASQFVKYSGTVVLIVSGFISFTVAMANPCSQKMEMGGMILVYGPWLSTFILLVIYLFGIWRKLHWKLMTAVLCIVNIAVGFMLHEICPS